MVYSYNEKEQYSDTHAAIPISLENIVLSKKSRTQKIIYCLMPFTKTIRTRDQSIETKSRFVVVQGQRRWGVEHDYLRSILGDKIVLKWREIVVAQHFKRTNCH